MPDEYDIDDLIGSGESEPPVIDVLIKSWIEELDNVYSQIQLTGMRYKLESAEGNDLDDIWGRTFQIKRYASESDDDYRSRLIVHTRVLMGSGTIPNCEAIIDSLLGYPGATNIESRWPGVNYISFQSIDAMRLAKASESKIKKLLPSMLAAGMSYEISLPIYEYVMDLCLKCDMSITYDIDAMIQDTRWADYDLDARFVRPRSTTYTMNAYMKTRRSRQYAIQMGITEVMRTIGYSVGLYLSKTCDYEYNLGAILTAFRFRPYNISARMMADMEMDYSLAAYLQRVNKKFYAISAHFEAA